MLSLEALNFKTACKPWVRGLPGRLGLPVNQELETFCCCFFMPGSGWRSPHLPSGWWRPSETLDSSPRGSKPPLCQPSLCFSDLVFPEPTDPEVPDTCGMQFTLEKETHRASQFRAYTASAVSKRDLLFTSRDAFHCCTMTEADGLPDAPATLSLLAVWPWMPCLPGLSHNAAPCRCSVKWNETMYDRSTVSGGSHNVL